MKILILANTTINKPGNVGLRIYNIIKALEKEGHDVTVFARASKIKKRNIFFLPFHEIFSRGLNFIRLYIYDFNHRILDSKVFETLSFIFINFFNYRKFDKVFLYEMMPNIAKFFKINGIEVITDIQNTLEKNKTKNIELYKKYNLKYLKSIDFIEQQTIIYSDKCICPNEISLKLTKEINPKIKSYICQYKYNRIPKNNNLIKKKEKFLKERKEINYLFAGNIYRRKGIELLYLAWPIFKEWIEINYPKYKIRLDFVGKNFYKNFLIKSDDVTYHGFTNVYEYFAKAHFLILPSFIEGYPKVLTEARALGTFPIISEGAGGSIKDKKSNIVISEMSAEGVFRALKKSIEIKNNWSEYCNSNFNNEFMKTSYEDQILSVLE